jgi:histidinol dehydrogenase
MKIIKFNKNFYNQFQTKIEKRNSLSSKSIQEDVKKIIYDVKKNGDKSLIKYAAKFDKVKINKQDISLDLSKIKIQSKLISCLLILTLSNFAAYLIRDLSPFFLTS